MMPLQANASWLAVLAERISAEEVQAFYEANPEYWLITHGHPPPPAEAAEVSISGRRRRCRTATGRSGWYATGNHAA